MSFFKKLFENKQQPEVEPTVEEPKGPEKLNNQEWPLAPPRHSEDQHFMMNEFSALSMYCFVATDSKVRAEIKEVNFFTVILMENGYGERYANILKNGILVSEPLVTQQVRENEDWKYVIQPWLENKTDYIPIQDGIIVAELSDRIRQLAKEIKSKQA